jgi:outer membrane biosynthesis protein TonB
MRWSLTISVILHVAILLAAFVVLPNASQFKVEEQDSIPVDIVSIEDLSKRQATAKIVEPPKPQEKVAPKPIEPVKDVKPAPEVAPEVKTAAREAAAEPEPKPEVKPEEPKKAEPPPEKQPDPKPLEELIKDTAVDTPPEKKEEPKKAEAKPAPVKPKVKPKPEEKKKPEKLNTDDIAAFLNKVDEKRAAPIKPVEEQGSPKQGEFNMSGADDALAATLADALRQRLAGCWNIPPGAREAQVIVKVHFALNSDGTVNGFPEVVNSSSDPLFASTAQSAVSAVMDCQTYDFLPADKYDLWRDNTINFNPNQMFPS